MDWLVSDELWAQMEPLLPIHQTHHPLGTIVGEWIIGLP